MPLDTYVSKYTSNANPINYGTQPTAAANTNQTNLYQQQIQQQLQNTANPVTANNPIVRAQTDAYDISSNRGLAQNRNALAQQAYAGGNLSGGGYGVQQQAAREAAAAARAANVGQVMSTEEGRRQQAQQQFMNMGQSGSLQQQQVTNQAGQAGDALRLNYNQLAQRANEISQQTGLSLDQLAEQGRLGDASNALKQQEINNQLELGRGQLDLGKGQLGVAGRNVDLGYYNTNTNADLQQQQINNALLGEF
jgi:hypothetical protein